MPLHLSTQANVTNLASVRFWQAQGVRRVNLARELGLEVLKRVENDLNEIAQVEQQPQMRCLVPSDLLGELRPGLVGFGDCRLEDRGERTVVDTKHVGVIPIAELTTSGSDS